MGIFEVLKDAIWGTDDLSDQSHGADPLDSAYLGASQVTTGFVPRIEVWNEIPLPEYSTAPAVVDVAARLDEAARVREAELDWRTSIVDLMKVVGMDGSLEERRELASELGYPVDLNHITSMDSFLYRAVMKKLSQNGGKVLAEFLD